MKRQRFVASKEAGCSELHKQAVVSAGFEDTLRTLTVSGRPLRVKMNDWVAGWEKQPDKIKELTENGIVPLEYDLEKGVEPDIPFLMGQVAGVIDEIKPAGQIVKEMVEEAVQMLKIGQGYLSEKSKL